jgi:hypothetical protein
MRLSSRVAAFLAAAIILVPAAAAHADEPDPEHGPGGTSAACSDGQVPGTGFESGGTGNVTFLHVGVQGGTDPAINHIVYVDSCLAFTPPNICVPILGCTGLRYGIYDSARLHTANCNGGPGLQTIHNNDSGNTVNPIPHTNNCPNG